MIYKIKRRITYKKLVRKNTELETKNKGNSVGERALTRPTLYVLLIVNAMPFKLLFF